MRQAQRISNGLGTRGGGRALPGPEVHVIGDIAHVRRLLRQVRPDDRLVRHRLVEESRGDEGIVIAAHLEGGTGEGQERNLERARSVRARLERERHAVLDGQSRRLGERHAARLEADRLRGISRGREVQPEGPADRVRGDDRAAGNRAAVVHADFEVDEADGLGRRRGVVSATGGRRNLLKERRVRVGSEADRVDRDVVRLRAPGLRPRQCVSPCDGVVSVRQEDLDPCAVPEAVLDQLVVRDEDRGAEVRRAGRVDRVEVRLSPAVVRDSGVRERVQVMRDAADIRAGEPRDAVEVDARDAVRAAEPADVLLPALDPQPVRVVLRHRSGAVDHEDDVLVDLRDVAVVDRGDELHGDVRGRRVARVERQVAAARSRERRDALRAHGNRHGELAAGDGRPGGEGPQEVEGRHRLEGGVTFGIVLFGGDD